MSIKGRVSIQITKCLLCFTTLPHLFECVGTRVWRSENNLSALFSPTNLWYPDMELKLSGQASNGSESQILGSTCCLLDFRGVGGRGGLGMKMSESDPIL